MSRLTWVERAEDLPRPGRVPENVAPGLVAASAELDPGWLERAYRQGLFPWFGDGEPVLWWSPDPRMVLHTAEFRLHRSLRKVLAAFLRTPGCEIRIDHDFGAVIRACAGSKRAGQRGTWIVPAMVAAYQAWHAAGRVHSVETWVGGRPVGGLYAVGIGRMVFGESMFSRQPDASKIALAALVALARANGVAMIDCQQQTAHLASLGARPVPREHFLTALPPLIGASSPVEWTYDPRHWALLDPRLVRPQDDAA